MKQVLSGLTIVVMMSGCGTRDSDGASSLQSISDMESSERRPDGKIIVRCRGGYSEVRTEDELRANQVCLRSDTPVGSVSDAFRAESCTGAALSSEDVISRVPFPREESIFMGSFPLHVRTRVCYKLTGCGDWKYNDESQLGAPLTDGAGAAVNRVSALTFLIRNDLPKIQLTIGGDSGKNVWIFNPVKDSEQNFTSQPLRLLGQSFTGQIDGHKSCMRIIAKATKSAPTPGENTRYYEAELAGLLRY